MPVIAIVETEASVPASTVTVMVDVIEPPRGGVTLPGENEMCTPAGNPPVPKLTAELNDPVDVTVTVSVVPPPAANVSAGELSDIEKSALGVIVNAKLVW